MQPRARARRRLRAILAATLAGAATSLLLSCSDGKVQAPGRSFPEGFLWGAAVAAFQTEMGGGPSSIDSGTDWWVWVHDASNIAAHRTSGDLPENGPASYERFGDDYRLARSMQLNAYRLSIEWSRIFPQSTAAIAPGGVTSEADLEALDQVADHAELDHVRTVLMAARSAGLEPLLTLNHFTLPLWLDDPIATRDAFAAAGSAGLPSFHAPAGWLDDATVREFAKFAAYAAWKLGDLVDLWATLNEPTVVVVNGYVNAAGVGGNFPPGAFALKAVAPLLVNLATAHARAYDAVKRWDTVVASTAHGHVLDGQPSVVGLVNNMVAFTPENPDSASDVAGAAHASYLFNQLLLNATVLGRLDEGLDGDATPDVERPDLGDRMDYVGVNYYLRGRISGLPAPVDPAVPLLDFLPSITYRWAGAPTAPPCPTECSEFGSEIYPQGFHDVLAIAGAYGRPVLVTENGIADATDAQRPAYLVTHLDEVLQAIADHSADVRGYFHWSLIDNYEWTAGYLPKFGLAAVDPASKAREPRPSTAIFAEIAGENRLADALVDRYRSP